MRLCDVAVPSVDEHGQSICAKHDAQGVYLFIYLFSYLFDAQVIFAFTFN